MNAIPCSICNEGGHKSRLCPTLFAPLKEGFYAPPAGHRPSGDDEDDSKYTKKPQILVDNGTFSWLGASGSTTIKL
jgi:hypothetical protein